MSGGTRSPEGTKVDLLRYVAVSIRWPMDPVGHNLKFYRLRTSFKSWEGNFNRSRQGTVAQSHVSNTVIM